MGKPSNQDSNQDQYGGYSGYSGNTPPAQPQYDPDDPYGASAANESATVAPGASSQQSYSGQQQQQQQQQQQYQTYQPPRSAVERQQVFDKTSTGMSARKAAIWSYALGPFSGIYFFIRERQNRFVRFSAAQSTLFSLGVILFAVVLYLLSHIPVLGFIIGLLGCVFNVVFIALALVWVFLMFQASRGVKFKLPFLGNYAERLAGNKGQL